MKDVLGVWEDLRGSLRVGIAFREQALCQQPTRHHDEAVPEPSAKDSLLFMGVGNDRTDEDLRYLRRNWERRRRTQKSEVFAMPLSLLSEHTPGCALE